MLKSDIPSNAVERVVKRHANGVKAEAQYFLRGAKVGWRYWEDDETLEREFSMRRGKYHGIARQWYSNGQLMWRSRYINGKEHGVAKQWDEKGRLLGTYRMNHGTGIDRWWVAVYRAGGGPRNYRYCLGEEVHWVNGVLHGRTRFWYGHLTHERYFWRGQPHGIWREWRSERKLERGYPQYYIRGKRVTKAQYLKACKTDKTLALPDQDTKQ